MRYGLSDSEGGGYSSPEYSSADEGYDSSHSTRGVTVPRSGLGRLIQEHLDDSSASEPEELDSEDEVELIGADPKPKDPWKDYRSRLRSTTPHAESSKAPWTRTKVRPAREVHDAPSQFEVWRKTTEEQVIRDGHERARKRRGDFRAIATNARAQHQQQQSAVEAQYEEEMRRMLEAMAIKQLKEEEAVKARFAEREKALWKQINEAIEEIERQEAEIQAAAIAQEAKQKEEEAARAAQAEKEAKERKAEAERLAKEHVAKQKREKEEAEKRAVLAEENQRQAKEKGKVGSEWREWVERQKWMKREVIEPIKSDRPTKMGLRQGMRLITRGLGQVVNTKEGILRVTSDIHAILLGTLPAEPSTSNPVGIEVAPKPYLYLLSHTSKALIKQAESEVAAKTDAAFPLARVVVGLFLRGHAAFGDVLFARFVKKCPLVIPFFPSRQPDQARDEYEKSTGRGSDESIADWIQRVSGIFTLYLAILQTPYASLVPSLPVQPNPDQLSALINPTFRFTAAWPWLAHALRDPLPALEPIAQLVTIWTEMLGAEAVKVWGQGQIGKVMAAIYNEGVEGGKIKGDSEATRLRLSLMVNSWQSLGYPAGRDWT